MSVDNRQLVAFGRQLESLKDAIPEIVEQLVVGEGVYAVSEARKICKAEGIVNNGTYRMNFHAGTQALMYSGNSAHDGSRPERVGTDYKIDVYNNLDYAIHLEYGFRSHFVPGYWAGKTFVYQPGFPGGMYVGPYEGFVPGKFVFTRAIKRTKATQDARLKRKFTREIAKRMKGGLA